jgi:hypothetical protein
VEIFLRQWIGKKFQGKDMTIKYDYNTISNLLISLGYDDLKKISSTKIAILTNENRVKVLENVEKKIKGANYDTKPSSESSVGRVKIGSILILAKPAGKQGKASAGVAFVVDTINQYVKTGPINVIFKANNKKFTIISCKKAEQVGGDTSGRKKADIRLIDNENKIYPISIKKDDAETWESADSYFSEEAKKIIDRAIKEKKTELIDQDSYFTIEPNIAVEATEKEKRDVVFGSDLLPNGSVVTKTFTSKDFNFVGDTLTINCSNIITKMSDVKDDKDVYFLIRNDKTRKSIKEYPGIRILAAYKKRINKNVVIVKR